MPFTTSTPKNIEATPTSHSSLATDKIRFAIRTLFPTTPPATCQQKAAQQDSEESSNCLSTSSSAFAFHCDSTLLPAFFPSPNLFETSSESTATSPATCQHHQPHRFATPVTPKKRFPPTTPASTPPSSKR